MAEHIYEKEALINRLESYLGKTFEMIDNKGMFEHVQDINLQKGIAGAVVEQCKFCSNGTPILKSAVHSF